MIIPINNITDIPNSLNKYRMFVYKSETEYNNLIARYPDRTVYVTKFYVLVEEI